MRYILLFGLLFNLLGTANAEPSYLVHISIEGPRSQVIDDWGSGVLVDPEHVLTCGHNIGLFSTSITIRFKNGDEIGATVLKRDVVYDLVLLKLDEFRYEKPVKLSEEGVKTGQTVTIWGFPGEEAESITREVSSPLIQLVGFRLKGKAHQGVSGGPALIGGKLVGIQTGSFIGIRCADLPQIRKLLEELP